ncbi:MAG TPA: inosine/xanthosine triphosphatase [Candidatus Acidoferrales bacterium]|nr:inosine/xanthosine triphosphatase [Candidatus Acidoferrales bacterium]
MSKIIVAVGTTRQPKLNALREALSTFGPLLDPNAAFEVAGEEVASGVTHTPQSRAEAMAGAKHRAQILEARARELNLLWQFFVGLEGGLDVLSDGAKRLVFLENWAYVSDGNGHSAYGQSGSVLLPETLATRVVDEGIELGIAIDAFAGERDIRDAQGAWGVLTRNLITRQDAFRVALINAFAPFFNAGLYRGTAPDAHHRQGSSAAS